MPPSHVRLKSLWFCFSALNNENKFDKLLRVYMFKYSIILRANQGGLKANMSLLLPNSF